MIPTLTPVKSTLIAGYAYDRDAQVLTIQFNDAPYVNHYRDVPPEVAAEFDAAESKGKVFGQAIRGKFEFSREHIEATKSEAES